MEYIELGKTGIKISVIGLGAWQWGSREWGWGRLYGKKDLLEAFEKAMEVGFNFIDTAEVYGFGRSEKLVGEAIRTHREDVVIATKVSPWHLSFGGVLRAADRSLRRLGVDVIDLYQVHWPNPLIPVRTTMKAMKRLIRDGKVRCVGVSNFNLKRLEATIEALAPLELASNQVRYNLLDRKIETNLLPYTQREKVTVIAHTPLARGLLTAKYSTQTEPASLVQRITPRFSKRNLNQLSALSQTLLEVAKSHRKTPSQVALNWLISKGNVVAIPGTKTPENAIDSAGAAGWRLDDRDIASLETVASQTGFDRISALPNLLKALTRT